MPAVRDGLASLRRGPIARQRSAHLRNAPLGAKFQNVGGQDG